MSNHDFGPKYITLRCPTRFWVRPTSWRTVVASSVDRSYNGLLLPTLAESTSFYLHLRSSIQSYTQIWSTSYLIPQFLRYLNRVDRDISDLAPKVLTFDLCILKNNYLSTQRYFTVILSRLCAVAPAATGNSEIRRNVKIRKSGMCTVQRPPTNCR